MCPEGDYLLSELDVNFSWGKVSREEGCVVNLRGVDFLYVRIPSQCKCVHCPVTVMISLHMECLNLHCSLWAEQTIKLISCNGSHECSIGEITFEVHCTPPPPPPPHSIP